MSPKRITINGHYIAIFSASERTSCALGICNSERVTVSLAQLLLNIHRSGYIAFRLVPRETAAVSAHVLCTQYNLAPDYNVDLFEATYVTYINIVTWLHKNSFVQGL